jgi:hypothetical protein
MPAKPFFGAFAALVLGTVVLVGRPLSVMVYNVENLFDLDGVSPYEEYQPNLYTPRHLGTKLNNVAEVLARFDEGRGPDIILFQEIEVDQTPDSTVLDVSETLRRFAHTPAAALLADASLPAEIAGWPAEVWLLKALEDRGLAGYTAIAGSDFGTHENGNTRSIKCVTFTRLPVRAVRQHPTLDARNILEVELDVEGSPLFVFNNHWKSGAGDPQLESVRVQNARVLRARLDEILRDDPNADVIIGGDFNSQYNQELRYPEMTETALDDVLRSQGNELAIRGHDRDLYNLWFELPQDQRGSDTYRGEWGTLMQLIISRGLYDFRGVQYDDNSFGVFRVAQLNADAAGAPVRWDGGGGAGSGFSDHLPIYARFRFVAEGRADRWLALNRPAQAETSGAARRVDYARVNLAATAIKLSELPVGAKLRDGSWMGRVFAVEGEVVPDKNPRVRVLGEEYDVFGVDDATRQRLNEQRAASRFSFYGELGTYKGRWQFVVRDPSWVK